MARINWDRENKKKAIRDKGSEPFFVEGRMGVPRKRRQAARPMTCMKCGLKVANAEELDHHLRRAHVKKPQYGLPISTPQTSRKAGRLVTCPKCRMKVAENELRYHLRRTHEEDPGSKARGENRSISKKYSAPPAPTMIPLSALVEEARPRLDDLILNLANKEGAKITSVSGSVSPQVAERIRRYFRRRTTV
jgi:hypothetical protein